MDILDVLEELQEERGDSACVIKYCYNAGTYSQTSSGYMSAILGQNKGKCTENNNESMSKENLKGWNDSTIVSKLTSNFVKDVGINEGYPILKWQKDDL